MQGHFILLSGLAAFGIIVLLFYAGVRVILIPRKKKRRAALRSAAASEEQHRELEDTQALLKLYDVSSLC